MPSNDFRCSDYARRRGDPLAGTAPPAARWLLIEHPGAWALDPWTSSGVRPAVRAELQRAADRAGARLLLIRRPERRGSSPVELRRWMVPSQNAETLEGRWATDHDLLDAVAAVSAAAPAPAGAATDLSLLLVCTHGARDVCCAVRGRPLAAALAQRWPEQTWECTHVGGDRFAPNLLVLPDGTYYGMLDPEAAVDVVTDHLAGHLRADYLRGVAGLPTPAQAALVWLVEHNPNARPTYAGTRGTHDTGWRVSFTVDGAPIVLAVTATTAHPARLTCRADRATSAWQFQVTDGPAGS